MIIDKLLKLKVNFVEGFGLPLAFIATFLEGLPLIGLFVPGALVIFIAGFFSKLGLINFRLLLIIAILGAILGDLTGYLIGKYFGKEFLHKYCRYMLISKTQMNKMGHIVHNHSGKSLIFGRLNPVTRCFAPFVSGAHKINFSKFMFYNIVGGVLYVFMFVSLGYIFGYSYRTAEKFEIWIILGTIAVIAVYYLDYFIKLLDKKMDGGKCDY